MVATAEEFANGGFASAGPPSTFVYIRHTAGSEKPMLVFAFSEGTDESMRVKISWASPTHLELTYGGQHTVDFQAVRYAGVDIDVQNSTR